MYVHLILRPYGSDTVTPVPMRMWFMESSVVVVVVVDVGVVVAVSSTLNRFISHKLALGGSLLWSVLRDRFILYFL